MSIFNHFKHLSLSTDQEQALSKLEAFLEGSIKVFMLKGYAGSGKTTILKGLVEYLGSLEKEFALLAPTGRAAKVIRDITGQEASTIHKGIYSYDELVEVENAEIEGGKSFFYYYKIRNSTDVANKIFIIDEASMLSDSKSEGEFFRFGTGHLLSDLITYSRITTPTAGTKIIFVGDPCQLAPVGDNSSKAFDKEYLFEKFQLMTNDAEMKEVKRQAGDSGILSNASIIRKSISSGLFNNFKIKVNGDDVFKPSYENFIDTWQKIKGRKIIIASKNKTCLDINLQIRKLKYGDSGLPIRKGDIMILGANNYRKGVFNGEFAVVNEIDDVATSRNVKFYAKSIPGDPSAKTIAREVTLRWRTIELVFPDSESSNKVVRGQVLENFLNGDNFLNPDEMQALYVDFKNRNNKLKPRTEEFKEAILNDDYFNCLLMKYGYAVTCHKAQGGEWDHVFTVWDHENQKDFDCLRDKQLMRSKDNQGFYRWAYTAITRASKKLYVLNPPSFNSYATLAIMDSAVVNSLDELTGSKVEMEEIELDNDLNQQLSAFGLLDQPLQLQDHFIKVRHLVRRQFIEITGWNKNNLEILFQFKREEKIAGLKTWINKENSFNGKYLNVPKFTNSEEFSKEIENLLKNLPNVFVKRNTSETILGKILFDAELEEQFPFIRNLFNDLNELLFDTGIFVDNIDHQQYKERYTFKRNQEVAVIDIEYKKNGFFGRVIPIIKQTNCQSLYGEILELLKTLKTEEHAI
ncbi:MAG: ATP-dependent DNA helicase [Candidatus Saccharimonadaceae bacterium]